MIGSVDCSKIFVVLGVVCGALCIANAVILDGVRSLHVWLTVSSLISKDVTHHKSLIFRQIELNWINAPLDHDNDYIGLYLDSEPTSANSMPVSIHRLAGQTNGHIITDYFLPPLDLYNETLGVGGDGDTAHDALAPIRYGREPRRPESRPSLLRSQCLGYCLAYHSRNKLLASNCLRTNPTWMEDSFQYISSRSMPTLMIPGSHNSATYPRSLDKSALNMINKYQMNQDEPIFNQLVFGIRHLDLRVGFSKVKQRPERLWIYHDIFRTDISVDEVLDQVRRFLDLTSHEMVIMDFHRFTVGFQNENQATQRERHAILVELIFSKLGPYIVPSYLGQHAPLSELVSAGKRLIIGYAARSTMLGSNELSILGALTASDKSVNKVATRQVQDIDAARQDQEDSARNDSAITNNIKVGSPLARQKLSESDEDQQSTAGRRSGLINKLKSLKLIGRTFSKRSLNSTLFSFSSSDSNNGNKAADDFEIRDSSGTRASQLKLDTESDSTQKLAKVALFFPPVRHLWPDKDTIEGLSQYMNDTTCRKYFGELRSMMVELTPSVFGAISDKYDGNRRLAQQVNREVTDWIRDRWLHCINIVASDYFLGNDLIQLSIYANKMRAHQSRNVHTLSGFSGQQCRSFKKISHLLDKSKIPVQFTLHKQPNAWEEGANNDYEDYQQYGQSDMSISARRAVAKTSSDNKDNEIIIAHTSADGNRVFLRPLVTANRHQSAGRERRDSFVDNFSDGFSNLLSSFKRLLNLSSS